MIYNVKEQIKMILQNKYTIHEIFFFNTLNGAGIPIFTFYLDEDVARKIERAGAERIYYKMDNGIYEYNNVIERWYMTDRMLDLSEWIKRHKELQIHNELIDPEDPYYLLRIIHHITEFQLEHLLKVEGAYTIILPNKVFLSMQRNLTGEDLLNNKYKYYVHKQVNGSYRYAGADIYDSFIFRLFPNFDDDERVYVINEISFYVYIIKGNKLFNYLGQREIEQFKFQIEPFIHFGFVIETGVTKRMKRSAEQLNKQFLETDGKEGYKEIITKKDLKIIL